MARYQKSTRSYSDLSVTAETKAKALRFGAHEHTPGTCSIPNRDKSERLHGMQYITPTGKDRTKRKYNQKQKVV